MTTDQNENPDLVAALGREQMLERQNAAMREALERAKAAIWDSHYGHGLDVGYARKVSSEIDAAIQPDAGARYLSPEQVKPLRDALAKILVYFTPEHLDRVSGADCGASAKAAIEHAKSLGL